MCVPITINVVGLTITFYLQKYFSALLFSFAFIIFNFFKVFIGYSYPKSSHNIISFVSICHIISLLIFRVYIPSFALALNLQ